LGSGYGEKKENGKKGWTYSLIEIELRPEQLRYEKRRGEDG